MDEKFLGSVVKLVQATDTCMMGVETAMECLKKQARVNRGQKVLNVVLAFCLVNVVSRVVKLEKKVKEFETKNTSEDSNTTKGE